MEIEVEINTYRNKIESMANQELLTEFETLLKLRKTGKEKNNELQINFNLIRIEERKRGINFHTMKLDNIPVQTPVNMIECNSSSIYSYGYNELLQMMYIRFRSKDTIYTYIEITPDVYENFLSADSKGKWVMANLVRKPRGITKIKTDVKKEYMRVGTKRSKK